MCAGGIDGATIATGLGYSNTLGFIVAIAPSSLVGWLVADQIRPRCLSRRDITARTVPWLQEKLTRRWPFSFVIPLAFSVGLSGRERAPNYLPWHFSL